MHTPITKIAALALIALAFMFPSGAALAGTPTTLAVDTPAGMTQPTGTSVVVDTTSTYALDGTEVTRLGDPVATGSGTITELPLAGPIPQVGDQGGRILVFDPQDNTLAESPALAPGATSFDGVLIGPHGGRGGGFDAATVATWSQGLSIVVESCDSATGCQDITVGTIGAAVYTPAASVVGDPWFKFASAYRAHTHLIVKTKSGRIVVKKDLGILAAGKHAAHFGCGTHTGRLFVHVHGVANDGAAQNSPIRPVGC